MTGILPVLLAVSTALAAGGMPHREGGVQKKVVGPPLRVGGYAALRSGATSTGGVELGWGLTRTGRFGLDLGASATSVHRVADFEPRRSFSSFNGYVDGVFAVGPTLNVGPTVGVSYRSFRQDWLHVQGMVTPLVGLQGTAGLLTQRTWQLQLTVRATADVVQTQMAFDTTELRALNPFELQLGGRLLFGRQRSALVPTEVR